MSQRLSAQYALSRVLGSAFGPGSLPGVLEAIGESLRAEAAELWIWDRDAALLRCTASWVAPGKDKRAFVGSASSVTFARGEGLPGRVLESGQPTWSEDIVAESRFARKQDAGIAGLHAAVVFPVQFAGETVGVIQFFYDQVLEPNAELLQTFADVGGQVGLFLEQSRTAETLMRQAREILDLATPVIRIWSGVLMAPMFGPFEAQQARQLGERVLSAVEQTHARVVILDLTGVPRIDTEIARRLIEMIRSARLLGATTVVTGMRAQIAMTVTRLGISLDDVESFTTLEDGLRRAITLTSSGSPQPAR